MVIMNEDLAPRASNLSPPSTDVPSVPPHPRLSTLIQPTPCPPPCLVQKIRVTVEWSSVAGAGSPAPGEGWTATWEQRRRARETARTDPTAISRALPRAPVHPLG